MSDSGAKLYSATRRASWDVTRAPPGPENCRKSKIRHVCSSGTTRWVGLNRCNLEDVSSNFPAAFGAHAPTSPTKPCARFAASGRVSPESCGKVATYVLRIAPPEGLSGGGKALIRQQVPQTGVWRPTNRTKSGPAVHGPGTKVVRLCLNSPSPPRERRRRRRPES